MSAPRGELSYGRRSRSARRMTGMRGAVAFALLFIGVALNAQSIRVGPEHVIPPASGKSARSVMLALFPRGDGVVVFWAIGALHETLLDGRGNVLSEATTPGVDEVGAASAVVAQAGDGYLFVQRHRSTGTTRAVPLDSNFHLRGKIVELATGNFDPVAVACGDTRCAVALQNASDHYTMLLGLDGSVINARLPVQVMFRTLVATTFGFIGGYTDDAQAFHTLFFDTNGVAVRTSDYGGKLFEWWTVPGMTSDGDGAIVVWPQDKTLNATRLGAEGAIVSTQPIATFTYNDFGRIDVACSGSECTAAVEWYYDGYSVFEGVFWPVHQIQAVRFATSVASIDSEPVLISKPSDNSGLRVAATPAGAILGWAAFRGRAPRIAFLGHGITPYAGDVNVPGLPFNSGWVTVGKVAATPGALAWTDYAADGQRSVRLTRIDDDGVPIDSAPAVLEQDDSDDYFSNLDTPADAIAVGNAGDSHVVAWQSTFANVMFARAGEAATTIYGQLSLPMLTDGRESVLVLSDYPSDDHLLLRFGSTGPPDRSWMTIRNPRSGALSNGRLFVQGEKAMQFVDVNTDRTVSSPAPLASIFAAAFAFGPQSVRSFFYGRDDRQNVFAGVQRFTLDGRPLDSHIVPLPQLFGRSFAIPLGQRFLFMWDTTPYGSRAGTVYAAVVDPETGVAATPNVIADDGRIFVALVPQDATHAMAVFTKLFSDGDQTAYVVGTEMLQIESDFHHRAAGH